MRKLLCLISCFMLAIVAGFAQTGINTVTPKASLDVQKSSDPAFTDGIIPPRITITELLNKSYSTEQQGALVYVSDVSGITINTNFNDPTSKEWRIRNIFKPGYYTFTGSEWVAMELDRVASRTYQEDASNEICLLPGQKTTFINILTKEDIIHNQTILPTNEGLKFSTSPWNIHILPIRPFGLRLELFAGYTESMGKMESARITIEYSTADGYRCWFYDSIGGGGVINPLEVKANNNISLGTKEYYIKMKPANNHIGEKITHYYKVIHLMDLDSTNTTPQLLTVTTIIERLL